MRLAFLSIFRFSLSFHRVNRTRELYCFNKEIFYNRRLQDTNEEKKSAGLFDIRLCLRLSSSSLFHNERPSHADLHSRIL